MGPTLGPWREAHRAQQPPRTTAPPRSLRFSELTNQARACATATGDRCSRPAKLLVALLVVAMPPASPDLAAQAKTVPIDCNRACLEGLMEQYLAAVVARDPKRLPLSADVTYTEQEGDGRR